MAGPEPVAVEDAAGGAPGHWLEMVRARAPGLHVSLQERGIARMARPPAAIAALPATSAREPRGRQPRMPVRPATTPPSVAEPPVARPVSAAAAVPSLQRPAESLRDLEPHSWESAALDDDQHDWTRVPTRRAVSVPHASTPTMPAVPSTVPAVRRLSAADAVVDETWNPSADAPSRAAPRVMSAHADSNGDQERSETARSETRRTPTRPELRPLPTAVTVEPARHSTATPVFAPLRDEDHALHRSVRARVRYPTPWPTPWRTEAFQTAAEELAAPRFPALPDEVSLSAPVRKSAAHASSSASPMRSSLPPQAPVFFARRDHVSSDLIGAWPTLRTAGVPGLRSAPEASWNTVPDVDRWPELLGDESDEENDPDLSLPSGHRERLDREQRGLSWNG